MRGDLGAFFVCVATSAACVRPSAVAVAPTAAPAPSPFAQAPVGGGAQENEGDPWLSLTCRGGTTIERLRSGGRVFGARCRDEQGKDHGLVRILDAAGGHELESSYDYGVLHGERRRWFRGGALAAHDMYVRGFLHGSSERFWENGTRSSLQTYAHGTLEGPTKLFAKNGMATWEGDYRAGKLHGRFVMRSEDGRVHVEGGYADGVPDGVFRRYDVEGHELARFEIRDGTGEFEDLRPEGPSRARGRLVKGLRSGPWIELTPEGARYEEATYLDGLLHGVFVRWDDERKSEETRYVRGERHGRSRRWYSGTTQLRVDATYRQGKLDGPYRAYDSGGAVVLEGAFVSGLPDGKWTRNYASGKPMVRLEARRGVLVGRYESLSENGQAWRIWEFHTTGERLGVVEPEAGCQEGHASWVNDDLRVDLEPCRPR